MVPELITTLDSSSWSISDDLRVPVVLCWIATPVRSHPEGQVAVITCCCGRWSALVSFVLFQYLEIDSIISKFRFGMFEVLFPLSPVFNQFKGSSDFKFEQIVLQGALQKLGITEYTLSGNVQVLQYF
ncbi:hypothetical protein AVEN_275257-1 [Araneus ventricosus]|uniref:Uncharacterized protein n=1 Tax=Araneus ventricosus TaxID=182803 RepID=A0A4Y2EQR3_ARAVE|nr:hypothetical protein AVEN_237463-1 [Araneus ventricosus]GBM30376.1 hypothetical protein AVEN_275257-1 [Araneus ventricosus]